MKSNINKKANYQDDRQISEMQRKLQRIEDKFAKSMGFESRQVVYGPFDRDFNREVMIDYLTDQYYPLNLEMGLSKEEFRQAIIEQMGQVIEQQIDAMQDTVSGYFKKQFPDKVFLFSNNLKHNMINSINVLKHETLHAGIYDLLRGKIPVLKTYKNSRYDEDFIKNLLTEHKMRSLVNNRNNMILNEIGSPDMIFQFYSFEENFVMFNTVCSMLEREVQSTDLNIDNIYNIMSIYLGSAGEQFKPMLDNKLVDVYGNKVPIKNYLKTYLEILRGPVESYDEKDKSIVGVVEPLDIENIQFEEIDSKIPQLVDELTNYFLSGNLSKTEMKKKVKNFCEKYKIGKNFE